MAERPEHDPGELAPVGGEYELLESVRFTNGRPCQCDAWASIPGGAART